ncbi:MAG: hypothetical protein K2X82_28005 [Gemmataceae bacterium]|nr:hypothetical protein [Gemmataceae bacterium]
MACWPDDDPWPCTRFGATADQLAALTKHWRACLEPHPAGGYFTPLGRPRRPKPAPVGVGWKPGRRVSDPIPERPWAAGVLAAVMADPFLSQLA